VILGHVDSKAGPGVFYGAAGSEAPAMAGRDVFVAGGGNSAGQAALHLAKWANQVTILVRAPSLAATISDYLIRQIGAAPNIDVRYRVQVAGGTGDGHLQSLVLQDTASGARRTAPADALFVLIGAQPRTEWLGQAVARDRWGFILTGPDLPASAHARGPAARLPLPLETSLPGVFAAGDVHRGSVKRIASAVGEGAATIPLIHRSLARAAADRKTLTGQHTRRGSPPAHHREPAGHLETVPSPAAKSRRNKTTKSPRNKKTPANPKTHAGRHRKNTPMSDGGIYQGEAGAGPGTPGSASSSADTPAASAAPIRWNSARACRSPVSASAAAFGRAHRAEPASAAPRLARCRAGGPVQGLLVV
jgi:hypothetical protein